MRDYSLFDAAVCQRAFWGVVEACYSRTWRQYHMPIHYHPRLEIMYVLKGDCRVHWLKAAWPKPGAPPEVTCRKAEYLGPGEYILLDANVPHALEVDRSCYIANIEFSVQEGIMSPVCFSELARTSGAFAAMIAQGQPVLLGNDGTGSIYTVLSQVIECFASTQPDSGAEHALMDTALAHLLLRISHEARQAAANSHMLLYVKRALALMREHMYEEVRISDIAKRIGVTPSYLQRIFKGEMGQTMVAHLNQMRIKRAKFLLARTEDTIMDIAFSIGFNSRQHFFHVFRQYAGLSPQDYRKQNADHEKQQLFLEG